MSIWTILFVILRSRDYRLQRVSRRLRTDPLVTGVLAVISLILPDGTKRGLITLSTESFDGIRAADQVP